MKKYIICNEKEEFYETIYAGFTNIKCGFRNGYDLSNALAWLRNREPTGLGLIKNISNDYNSTWINFIEKSKQAELLHFPASK